MLNSFGHTLCLLGDNLWAVNSVCWIVPYVIGNGLQVWLAGGECGWLVDAGRRWVVGTWWSVGSNGRGMGRPGIDGAWGIAS